MKKGEGKMIKKKKTFAGQKRQNYLSFTSMYGDFTNSEKKKTIQNTIGKRKIARWITLTSVWPRPQIKIQKNYFLTQRK